MTQFRIRPVIAAAIAAAMLTSSLSAAAEPPQPEARYVKSQSVNVRGGPGTTNSVLEVLILGTEVQIYATQGNWNRISPPGKPEKWIYAPLLQREKPVAKVKAESKPKNGPAAPQTKPEKKTDKQQTQDKAKTSDAHDDQPDHGKDQSGPRH